MLKQICFIKTVLFLFAFSVSSSVDYRLLKNAIFNENVQTKNIFNKHVDYFLQQKRYGDDVSVEFDIKQRSYNDILGQLRMILNLIFKNPNLIIYFKNFGTPVYTIDVKRSDDLEFDNASLVLRQNANSHKDNDKKASDSSESSELSDDDNKQDLRYHSCERGRKKCVKACKSAYREACYIESCFRWLRRRLRVMCKISCRKWFS